jgi:hypothetical protein
MTVGGVHMMKMWASCPHHRPPLGPRGRHSRLGGREGDSVPTMGQTLWHSRYTIIPLRCTLSNYCISL